MTNAFHALSMFFKDHQHSVIKQVVIFARDVECVALQMRELVAILRSAVQVA